MKNILFCTMAAAVMAACSSTPTLMEYTQKGEPISPIYITGDTTQLILTDYVPMTDDWSKMEISDAYKLGPVSDGELSIIRKENASFGSITFWINASNCSSLPVGKQNETKSSPAFKVVRPVAYAFCGRIGMDTVVLPLVRFR